MDEKKALRYNKNKPEWSLIHFESLIPLINVLKYGELKYSIFENEFGEEIKGSEVDKNNIILKDETCITLGKKYVDEFMFQYREYLIS